MSPFAIDLRMLDAACNTETNTSLMPFQSGKESTLGIIAERTTQAIAKLIAKCGDAGQAVNIVFHRQRIHRQLRRTCSPTFSIYINSRVYFVYSFTDGTHGFQIVNAHQVEAETIDMIFVHPVFHTFHHIFTHHGTLRRCLITTPRSIGKIPFRCLTIKITGNGTLEIAPFGHCRMIIHHIHHHTDTCLMQRHHHLFKFTDTNLRSIRVGRIRTIWHIIILRVISPIVLRSIQLRFVH